MVLGAIGAVVLIGYVALQLTPEWFGDDRLPDSACGRPSDPDFKNCLDAAKARADDRRAITTATLAILAGGIATIGAVLTGLSYRLNRAGQITERFTRATDQVGSAELEIRLGGIYALERIARDSSDDHPQVMEVLTAYVREHAAWPPRSSPASTAEENSETLAALTEAIHALERIAKRTDLEAVTTPAEPSSQSTSSNDQDESPPLPTDVQAVMSVLGRRTSAQDRPGAVLDLARTDVRRVVLRGEEAHLEGANLEGAHLEGANLEGAHLEGANLEKADLEGAHLEGAHLEKANLEGAHLEKANLEGAHLEKANLGGAELLVSRLQGAYLTGARLRWAHCREARLGGAHLQDADLTGAHFEHADLGGAQLQGAGLIGAQLQGADLTGARLQGADLTGAFLQGADLTGAFLQGAKLEGALFDDDTDGPTPDFNAEARGAIRIDKEQKPDSVSPPD